jgi:hypothetical protein
MSAAMGVSGIQADGYLTADLLAGCGQARASGPTTNSTHQLGADTGMSVSLIANFIPITA